MVFSLMTNKQLQPTPKSGATELSRWMFFSLRYLKTTSLQLWSKKILGQKGFPFLSSALCVHPGRKIGHLCFFTRYIAI